MIASFNIEYRTNWGEEVRLLGSVPELGGGDFAKAIPLQTTDGTHWSTEAIISGVAGQPIKYSYFIYKEGNVVRKEWDSLQRNLYIPLISSPEKKRYRIYDSWKNIPDEQYFYSSAFTESLLAHYQKDDMPKSYRKGLIIKAYVPRIGDNYCLAICGNQDSLGNWDADKARLMSDANFPEWVAELDAGKLKFPLEYKFVLYNKKEKKAEAWENNPNRYMADPAIKANETCVIADRFVFFDVPAWKGSGVAIPVFSLKSEKSFGVGDFGDLKQLIDWAVKTDQKIVQILPVNDTTMTHTWTDSYPYNSISIYAFHPMYANLSSMGKLENAEDSARFAVKQKELNALPTVDYEAVNRLKWEYFRLLFKQEGDKVLASNAFNLFFEENKEWLKPYAVFSYLRDAYKTPDFRQWPKCSEFSESEIEKMCRPHAADYLHIAIYYYLQYYLHLQLLEATTYARAHGVVLKGDIPIGISRNSVEAWTEPYYFNLNGQAGAPPDDFSVNGQNWGFPTYNWEVMEKDGYKWWMKRFYKMSEYFDAYRIDHILGFFRIWEIPMHAVHGLLGQFVPALPMSREEIESYGLPFRSELYLKPYIHEYFLSQLFGPHTDFVKQNFIEATDTWEVYRMRAEFDTQRKVETYFAQKTDSDSLWIRDGLYALISDVLFVADQKEPDKYHPRIGVQHDFIYRALTDWEKAAFNRLYDQYYYYRHNEFWRQQAMKKLPQLTQSTRMLVCGEDLGMIPDCVAWVMNDLRILSLEIQRMPKNPADEFGHLSNYPYRSVCTISTHDMSTLRGWWQEDYQQTQRYYNHIMGHYGTAPAVATPELCEEVVRNHLYSNSLLCILSLQDWLSIDERWRNPNVEEERINVPANPKNYWRYRMHLTLEQLMKADSLNEKIKELIAKTGRNPEK
ncbi:4-alpha-glucanotransferase [uncultured Bacteroides sp.]|uniref:4-alpha-glucanotransferase n=1 Tax=uncultured Bacteroides sp. TaxID=162156 RepID=UPI002AA95E43|nr:4-alpha-glucanotransferase [uncultured Bacteroides sp.]